jgi:hypothetical protein
MARNEEKALTLFSRWQTFKKEFHAGIDQFLSLFYDFMTLIASSSSRTK